MPRSVLVLGRRGAAAADWLVVLMLLMGADAAKERAPPRPVRRST